MEKPLLVISACLLGAPVRFDQEIKRDDFVCDIARRCRVIKVCPETGIGLPVPRPRVFLYKAPSGEIRVIQEGTKKDITNELLNFCERFLKSIPLPSGFILKSKSPSCSPTETTKTYSDLEGEKLVGFNRGILGKLVPELFPEVPLFDENTIKTDEGKRFLLHLGLKF